MTVTATVRDERHSAGWAGPDPTFSVIVSTHGRAGYLAGMLDALERQSHGDFEAVVADNGSPDDTWDTLLARCETTPLRLRALRLDPHDGPAVPRNTAVERSRGRWLAFTDDDCLPAAQWLTALQAAAGADVTVVQGRTDADPQGWGGPWGRTLRVSGVSGLYETANLACPRTAFDAAGGFPAERLLSGRAFGEDVLLGARLARAGRVVAAPDALVHHRVLPGSYRQFLSERRRLEGFPALVRQVPELRSAFTAGVFLSRRTATADAGVAALGVAAALQQPLFALGAAPWAAQCWSAARQRPGRHRLVRSAQLGLGDLVAMVALVRGSARARRLVL
jgi:hypothetical protein